MLAAMAPNDEQSRKTALAITEEYGPEMTGVPTPPPGD
jgi:hypothetical protein